MTENIGVDFASAPDVYMSALVDRTGVIMMQQGLFTLDVPEALARKMKREEYYRVRSWLRSVKRTMVNEAAP